MTVQLLGRTTGARYRHDALGYDAETGLFYGAEHNHQGGVATKAGDDPMWTGKGLSGDWVASMLRGIIARIETRGNGKAPDWDVPLDVDLEFCTAALAAADAWYERYYALDQAFMAASTEEAADRIADELRQLGTFRFRYQAR